jgi:hypothetical protein
MSTRCVFGALVFGLVALGCAEPNKFNPADLARADAQGGSGGRGGIGGAGAAGGSGAGGSVGGTTTVDAPVAGSGGNIDADPGSDTDAACNAGVTRCEGAVVMVCTVTGTWVMKETCAAVCTAGACGGMCAPGSKHCGNDQTPETCSDLGEWVPEAMPCPNVCSGAGLCTGMCKPGSKRCSGTGNLTVQTCDENGTWVNGMVCPNICSSGSCGGDCMPDAKRCGANNVQETCSAMGTWEPAMTCQFVCMGAACAGECKPATKRCSALIPQECDQSGRWQSMTACPNLCMNGACTGDCMPNQKRCSGNVVQTCSPAGRYVASETCPFVCQGSGVCGGQCVPGRRQCSGTTPQVCSNDGQWMNTTGNECLKDRGATCGNANECESRSCVGGHCCNSGEIYCDGACRASGYCCNNAACSIANGTGRCMGGSCGVATCNTGYTNRNDQCVPCGGNGQPCCGSGTCNGSRRCSNNTTVVEPFCDNGTCRERTQDTCSGTGRSCQNGQCVCGSGLTDCSGTCVDTRNSNQHCGGCNRTCGPNTACMGGRCESTCVANFNQECRIGDCRLGRVACNGQCTFTQNREGTCGGTCRRCVTGECRSDQSLCSNGEVCQSNGACGIPRGDACPAGSSKCINSTCKAISSCRCANNASGGFDLGNDPDVEDCRGGSATNPASGSDCTFQLDGATISGDCAQCGEVIAHECR